MINRESLIRRLQQLSQPLIPIAASLKGDYRHLSGIKALIFDIYGTLFISGSGDIGTLETLSGSRGKAMQEALSILSPPAPHSGSRGVELFHSIIRQEHSRQIERGIQYPEVEIRKVWKEVLAALNNEGLYGGAITAESIERVAVEYECLVNPVWPMPGLKDILEKLAEGLHLGIVSNAQFYTPLLFPALLGETHTKLGFKEELCFWSYRRLQAKPSAVLFIALKNALEKSYNILPAEALYVGNDLLNDILPAAELGFKTALFAGDSRSLRLRKDDPRTKNTEADIIITSLDQLQSVITGNSYVCK